MTLGRSRRGHRYTECFPHIVYELLFLLGVHLIIDLVQLIVGGTVACISLTVPGPELPRIWRRAGDDPEGGCDRGPGGNNPAVGLAALVHPADFHVVRLVRLWAVGATQLVGSIRHCLLGRYDNRRHAIQL